MCPRFTAVSGQFRGLVPTRRVVWPWPCSTSRPLLSSQMDSLNPPTAPPPQPLVTRAASRLRGSAHAADLIQADSHTPVFVCPAHFTQRLGLEVHPCWRVSGFSEFLRHPGFPLCGRTTVCLQRDCESPHRVWDHGPELKSDSRVGAGRVSSAGAGASQCLGRVLGFMTRRAGEEQLVAVLEGLEG